MNTEAFEWKKPDSCCKARYSKSVGRGQWNRSLFFSFSLYHFHKTSALCLCLSLCFLLHYAQTRVSLIRPALEKSLLDFDWVWLFVPVLMASCQSDLLSVMITAASFPCCLLLWSFPNLAGLLAQSCSFRFRSCLMRFVGRVRSDLNGSCSTTCRLSGPDQIMNVSIPPAHTELLESTGLWSEPKAFSDDAPFPVYLHENPSFKQLEASPGLTVVTVLLHHWHQLATVDFHTSCSCWLSKQNESLLPISL